MRKASIISGIIVMIHSLAWGQAGDRQSAYTQYLDHPWVDSVLSTLSMEEKIAQTIWVHFDQDDAFPELMESARSVVDLELGGLIFSAKPDAQMQKLSDYCRSRSSIPLAIALEGRWDEQFPNMLSLAAIASDSLRYLAGTELAAQLRKEGVSLIIAEEIDEAVSYGLKDRQVMVLDHEKAPGVSEFIKGIDAASIGEISQMMDELSLADSVDYRARQVLAFKYWVLQQDPWTPDESGRPAFMRDLYAHSLTVLHNREQLIPVKHLERTRIACLAVNKQSLTDFQSMAGLYTRTDNYFWNPGSDNSDALCDALAAYDLVLAAVYPDQSQAETEALLRSLMTQTRLIVTWFGDPASLDPYRSIVSDATGQGPEGLILAYEQNTMTESLAPQLIFGGIGGSGKLPVAAGEHYPAGHGITTSGGLRLQYGFPENAGLNARQLNHAIDSIVKRGLEAGAYPGCQVIVARKGTVVFHKAYGYHTYDKRIEVRNHDLYDLASVTKISGPLSGLMKLEGMGKFSYQDQLGDYCSAMKGSDKADLELKDILAHRAGLYPWIPYYEPIIKKNGEYKKRFLRTDAGGKYSLQVADRVYLSNTFKSKIFKVIRKSELGEQKYLYSGLAFFLFPTVIENLSGQPYETFLSEEIYHRLGAWELLFHPRSAFPASRIVPTEIDSVFRKQLIHGYVHDEGAAMMGAYAGNAGLFASSNDLLKLIEMYRRMGTYGGEQIIEAEVLKEYTSYQFPELENRRGLGFDKPLLNENDGTPRDYPCPGAPPSSFGHSGFTGTFVWADPDNEISYVFLSNRVYTSRTNQLLYEMNIRTNILQSVYDSIVYP